MYLTMVRRLTDNKMMTDTTKKMDQDISHVIKGISDLSHYDSCIGNELDYLPIKMRIPQFCRKFTRNLIKVFTIMLCR